MQLAGTGSVFALKSSAVGKLLDLNINFQRALFDLGLEIDMYLNMQPL